MTSSTISRWSCLIACLAQAQCGPQARSVAGPTPAAGALTFASRPVVADAEQPLCEATDLVLSAVDAHGAPLSQVVPGSCSGPCSNEAQRDGATQLAAIEADIAAGTSSDSETDYNFTECIAYSAEAHGTSEIAGHAVTLLELQEPGPHDVTTVRFALALVHCDRLYVSGAFGATYANVWQPDELGLSAGPAHAIIVRGIDDAHPAGLELMRLDLGAGCAQPPTEVVGDAEAM